MKSLDPVFKELSAKRSTRRARGCAYAVVPSSPQTANVDTYMAEEMEEKEREREREEKEKEAMPMPMPMPIMMTNPWMAITKDPLPSTVPCQSNRNKLVPKILVGCNNNHHNDHHNHCNWSAAATEEKPGHDEPIVLSPRVPHIIALPRTPRSHMATTT